jgi:hypothetical protein
MRTADEIVGAVLLLSTDALSVRLRPTCPAGTRAIPWNKTGPAGPAGTTGISVCYSTVSP